MLILSFVPFESIFSILCCDDFHFFDFFFLPFFRRRYGWVLLWIPPRSLGLSYWTQPKNRNEKEQKITTTNHDPPAETIT